MSKEAFTADRILVSVQGTFNTEHIFASSQQAIGKLALNAAKTEGFFLGADGSQLRIRKTSFWKTHYEISQEEKIIGTAAPRGTFKRAFEILYQGETVELKPGGSKFRSWSVRDAMGGVLCEFIPRKSLKRGAQIRIGAEIPLPLLVLCYLLVTRRWQEESSAS